MNKKNIIKITLDIAMAILFVTFFNKNLISFKFHIRSGCIFGIFILIHIFFNRKWIVNISKRLFDKKLKLRVRISYIVSLLSLVSVILIIASGILMMNAPNYDRVMFWKMLHFGSSYLSIGLIGIHIGLYWNFVMNIFKRVFKIKNNNKVNRILAKICVVLVLVFGIYTTYQQEYFIKLNNTLTYVVQQINPQDLEQPKGEQYEKESALFVTLVTTYGSIMSVFAIGTYYADSAIKRKNKSESYKNLRAS